jgi:hypothetical protein
MVREKQALVVYLLISFLMASCGTGLPSQPSLTPSLTPQFLLSTPTQLQPTMNSATTAGNCPSPQEWEIEFHREGGIMGVTQLLKVSSDGTMLAQDLRKGDPLTKKFDQSQILEIESLLMDACPFATRKTTQTCADCFEYSLSIQMDETVYRVKVRDASIPETMQPLIGYLNKLLQQTITP